jgi:oxygen-independent coproporphyrinogen III oxidase
MHLYIHVPFCKQACHYCDFHFSVNMAKRTEMVQAICKEIELQKVYLKSNVLSTVYFGGGTPSLLNRSEIGLIFNSISKTFTIQKDAEITIECNPDDITIPRLEEWKEMGINRLSIGIQSFNENHLKFLNRAHSSEHSIQCIKQAKQVGFDNLTIDLIYAIPSESNDIWNEDLAKAIDFNIPHLSSYALTIEEKTVFGKKVKQKTMMPIDDDFAAEQFNILLETTQKNGYEQYEISNFAKNNKYAKHNTSYWKGDEYLGVGPSAHSFNKISRQWNISSNAKYIKSIQQEIVPSEMEILTSVDRANEYIMTGLRTKWGIELAKLNDIHSIDKSTIETQIRNFEDIGLIITLNGQVSLTNEGKLKADFIASELFF